MDNSSSTSAGNTFSMWSTLSSHSFLQRTSEACYKLRRINMPSRLRASLILTALSIAWLLEVNWLTRVSIHFNLKLINSSGSRGKAVHLLSASMVDKKRKKPMRNIQQIELPFKLRASEMRSQMENRRNIIGMSSLNGGKLKLQKKAHTYF